MPGRNLQFRLDNADKISQRLAGIAARLEDPKQANQALADYMVNAVKLRFTRDKRAADGTPWAALTEATLEIRSRIMGSTAGGILVQTGSLMNSVRAQGVTRKGFTIRATDHAASYMQLGIKRTSGIIKNKVVPKRPFLGFSDTNRRRIRETLQRFYTQGTL